MFKFNKIFVLMLVAIFALHLIGCDFLFKHDGNACVERKLEINLQDASLIENYYDPGFDGRMCYHAFTVNDGFENELGKKWLKGTIPTEAIDICEASSFVNGRRVINFPTMSYGLYYYEHYRDSENERVYFAVLDTSNDILYYFFASGQAIQYPNNR
jgi:hypothetical protein